jgi:long-chain acyl-CoA synthetase
MGAGGLCDPVGGRRDGADLCHNIAPQHLENLLKTDSLISQAMVYGDARPYPVALLTLDAEELTRFATSQGLLTTDYAALRREPIVVAQVQRIVEVKNASLPSYARIRKFAIIAAAFTEAAGEVTPTQKIKRRIVAERYGECLNPSIRRRHHSNRPCRLLVAPCYHCTLALPQ